MTMNPFSLRRLLIHVLVVAVFVCGTCLAACTVDLDNLTGSSALLDCADGGGVSCDAGTDTGDVRPAQVPWVDPERCVLPCTHPDESALVGIESTGQRTPVVPAFVRFNGAAQPYLLNMLNAAYAAGYNVTISSAYRDYNDQLNTFQTTTLGRAARPGHSEHELGLAADLDFPVPAANDWISQHAHEYGFVRSFPDHKEKITGTTGERWHYRYVGPPMATEMFNAGLCPEEYFHLHPEVTFSGDCTDCTAPESNEACGSLTADGDCNGTVIEYCFEGATATRIDCSAVTSTCIDKGPGTGAVCQ